MFSEVLTNAKARRLAERQLTFFVPETIYLELDTLCKTRKLNRSALLRGLLQQVLRDYRGET